MLMSPTLESSALSPTWIFDRSLVVSMVASAPSPLSAPPALSTTFSLAMISFRVRSVKSPGVRALPSSSREVLSPIFTRVVKSMVVSLSAPPPAITPPAVPLILGMDNQSLWARLIASMAMSRALMVTEFPTSEVTLEVTVLSIPAPLPANTPPAVLLTWLLKTAVWSATILRSPVPRSTPTSSQKLVLVKFSVERSMVSTALRDGPISCHKVFVKFSLLRSAVRVVPPMY